MTTEIHQADTAQPVKRTDGEWRKHFKLHRTRIGDESKHQCCRCWRYLPWEAFAPVPVHTSYDWRKNNRGVHFLDGLCITCRQQLKGRWTRHRLYSPKLDRFFQKRCSSQKSMAKARGIAFMLNKDDALGLYIEQGGKCAISGVPMTFEYDKSRRINIYSPSIDRIDSSGHYTVGNVQIVCSVVNMMKGELGHAEFIVWCSKIVDNQISKEAELRDFFDLEAVVKEVSDATGTA